MSLWIICAGPECSGIDDPDSPCRTTIETMNDEWIVTENDAFCEPGCHRDFLDRMQTRDSYIVLESDMPTIAPGEWRESDPEISAMFGPFAELREKEVIRQTVCFPRDEEPSGPTGDPDFNRIIERYEELTSTPPQVGCPTCSEGPGDQENVHRLNLCQCECHPENQEELHA